MRKEALTSSVYIVTVMLVASLLTLANYIMSRDKTGNSDIINTVDNGQGGQCEEI